jgi:MFS superfamily sulfate permease-like transporter
VTLSPALFLRRFAVPPAWIPGELAAGASVAAVAIPIGLAYSQIVGVSPVIGLYASIAPTLAYALFGPSRYLIVGPDTATCMLVAATLTTLGFTTPETRASAAAGLAILTGLGCFAAAALRMGFVANLFSRPVLVGYLTGVALILLHGQIGSWTGVHIKETGLLRALAEIVRRRDEVHPPTLACAAGLFVGLRLVKHFAPRVPAPAVAVVAAIAISAALDLKGMGVETVGHVPSGLPAPRLPAFLGTSGNLGADVLGILAISFASGILTARSFGTRLGEVGSANLELVGFGAANLAAGLFQGFGVTGADSRTAVGLASGGRTLWTGVAAALFVGLAVTLLTGFLAFLPIAALGAVLASAAFDLMDLRAFGALARVSWQEFVFALAATGGVIWIGVLPGVFIAVGLTLLHVLRLMSFPRSAALGRLPGGMRFATLDRNPDARPVQGIVIYSFEASICFLNAEVFRNGAMAALSAGAPADWFVLDASIMTNIDSSGLDALEALRQDLTRAGVGLAIAGGHDRFARNLERTKFAASLAGGRLFHSVAAAVEAIEGGALAPEPAVSAVAANG